MGTGHTKDLCNLIVNVTEKFNTGSLKDKKMIFSFLGENFHLQDGVLFLELHPGLLPLIKQVPIIKRKYRALDLAKNGSSNGILEPNSCLISIWSTLRTVMMNYGGYIYTPKL